MDYTNILLKPLITEKSTFLKDEENQIVFFVAEGANKIEIKKAVEQAFKVKVDSINVSRKKPQLKKRFGRPLGKQPGYKKAYIRLAPGQKVDYFEGV